MPRQFTWRSLAVGTISVILAGCTPGNYLTPRASISNSGLNTLMSENSPSFNSDGRLLVFSSNREGSENIYLFDLETRQMLDLPQLNRDDWSFSEPDISDDGRYIVYLSNALGRSDVYLYDRQTRQQENISNRLPGDVRNPSISGNGRFITFESNGAGQWDIEIYDRGAPEAIATPSPVGT